MYKTVCIILKNKDVELRNYCSSQCKNAKLLKNTITYRLRQLFFAWQKDYINLSEHEKEVLNEFTTTYDKYSSIGKDHMFPTYNQFERMLRNTNNPDFFNGLPAHSSQYLIKNGLQDFKSYFNALKKYRENPSKFTNKPKLPKYAKSDEVTFSSSNQECKIINGQLKLPKLNTRLNLGSMKITDNMRLYRIQIKPYYDTYKVCLVFEISNKLNEVKKVKKLNKKNVLGIDLGVNNIITTSNNCGLFPFVIKGNEIKSRNQWYNKLLAKYKSQLSISTKQNSENSKKIQQLNMYRNNYTTDKYNKIASYIVNYCKDNDIGTIVIGKNDQWKSETDMRKKDKQNFVFIAHSLLVNKIKMMAMNIGIDVIEQEESYTSKASFLDNDDIPIYEKDKNDTKTASYKYKFSGKRIKRGLYKTKEGILINADVNGASNVIRKALGNNIFDDIQNFDYLVKTVLTVRI